VVDEAIVESSIDPSERDLGAALMPRRAFQTALYWGDSMSVRSMIHSIRSPSSRFALGTLLLVGFVGGAIAVPTFNGVLDATSSDAFCLQCHSEDIGPEYRGTVHDTNATGIRVTCADCHIPKEYVPKVYRKATAGAKDVYHQILGTINTPEKFEANRLRLATHTWEEMNENDSKACRYCHDAAQWDVELQREKSRDYHSPALAKGKTCIDCHKGNAHKLPEGIETDHQVEGIDF
jgi:cytochrome c-type protein NapC